MHWGDFGGNWLKSAEVFGFAGVCDSLGLPVSSGVDLGARLNMVANDRRVILPSPFLRGVVLIGGIDSLEVRISYYVVRMNYRADVQFWYCLLALGHAARVGAARVVRRLLLFAHCLLTYSLELLLLAVDELICRLHWLHLVRAAHIIRVSLPAVVHIVRVVCPALLEGV